MPSTNTATVPPPDVPPIEVQHVEVLPRGEVVATLTIGSLAMGARMLRPGGRAPALVALADDELRARVEAAILARVAGGGA
jgi:hypothetical protein